MTRLRMTSAMLGVLLVAACGPAKPAEPSAGGSAGGCMSRAYPNIGGPISLVNQAGEAVTEETYKGHPTLIYFGFTYCPDVCPMTLVTVKRAYDRLPEDVTPPQTLLISIDPERDTPEQLAQYVSTKAFPANLQGLTGTPEQVRSAADAFLADYSRIEQPDSASEYSMDHTSLLYLMDEDWKLKTFFTHEDTDETIATCLTELLEE
ncbi:SCO family protein [Hyphomonas jannaschiana]|nr:SCO family protein [Hyphomonas jannaschiana]MCA8890819.1 SCO family protein [Hyphomonas sp.]